MTFAGVIAHGAKGDGFTDDTLAIQSALNDGRVVVFPPGTYVVSNQLSVGSNTYVKLMPGATLFRKAGTGQQCASTYTNANFFVNSDVVNGNENITIEGGVYDGNEANQTPINYTAAVERGDTLFGSVGMRFKNVTHLRLKSLTMKNNPNVQIQVGTVTDFQIEDITVYYSGNTYVHKETLHVNGPATLGVIRDLRDNGGNDCIVAINANDDTFGLMCEGDINFIQVENLSRNGLGIAPYIGSAVMLLNSTYNIRDVTIRGVHGTGFQATSAVMLLALEGPPTGIIDRIVIEDCDVATPNVNDAFCFCTLNIGGISFNNNRWHPGTGTADSITTNQCFFQQNGGSIESLFMSGNQIIRHNRTSVSPIYLGGSVGTLTLANTLFSRDDGIGQGGYLVDAPGSVGVASINGVACSNLDGVVDPAHSANITALTISGLASLPTIT